MSITEEQVRHVAKLASLELSDEEILSYQKDLSEILTHVESLSQVDTTNVKPTSHVHGSVNAFRDDVAKKSLPKEEALKNAPDRDDRGIRVPKII